MVGCFSCFLSSYVSIYTSVGMYKCKECLSYTFYMFLLVHIIMLQFCYGIPCMYDIVKSGLQTGTLASSPLVSRVCSREWEPST